MALFTRRDRAASSTGGKLTRRGGRWRGEHWTMGLQLGARATSVALVLLVLLGPVLGGVAVFVALSQPAQASAGPGRDFAAEKTATELGQHAVVVWLQAARGDEQLLNAYIPGSSRLLPEHGATVSEPAIAAATELPNGVWSVTVAATVAHHGVTLRRYFQVPVQVAPGAAAVLAAPAEVAGPGLITGSSFTLAYHDQVEANSPVRVTVQQFLDALLTGQGEISRYTSPGVRIAAVVPAPFVQVQITDLVAVSPVPYPTPKDGTKLEVLVTAAASVTASGGSVVQYPLTLAMRAGRWEIATVRAAPLLALAASATAPASSAVPQPTPGTPSRAPVPAATGIPTVQR